MSESAQVRADRYGNWMRPSSAGLFGLSLAALIVAGGGVVFAMLFMVSGKWQGMLVVLGLTAAVVLIGFVRFGGRTLAGKLTDWVSLARRRARGETLYVTGALSTLPPEMAERLPGVLLDVETVSGSDGLGRRYSLLHHKAVGQLAAVFGCAPNGAAMQDQAVVNGQVANFGQWVSSLSVEDGLTGATIVVDSASESSAGMVQAIKDTHVESAPQFAAQVLGAAADTLPGRTSTVNVYATMVYDVETLAGAKNDLDAAVAEVAARMPSTSTSLASAGGNAVTPLVEHELSQVAELAYKPSRDQEMALDALEGLTVPRSWEHAGPEFFDDSAGRIVRHDGVASATVMMTVPPQSFIHARSFDALFGPNPKFLRKRVAIFYRPVDPGRGARTVDQQVKNAQWRMDTRRSRPTAYDRAARAVAEKTEEELAAGARLSMFSMMVTVTFADEEKAQREALHQLKMLMTPLMMEHRFVEHAGSAAFHITLPFGVLPWRYSAKPVWLEGAMD